MIIEPLINLHLPALGPCCVPRAASTYVLQSEPALVGVRGWGEKDEAVASFQTTRGTGMGFEKRVC